MAGPKSDVILARLHGAKVEYTGVVAGMSGSPVYIDGKLVGAIAYRIGEFSKEPIAGITPAASMMEINELDKTPAPELDAVKSAAKVEAGRTASPGHVIDAKRGDRRIHQSPETDRDTTGLQRIQRRDHAAVWTAVRVSRGGSGDGSRVGQRRQAA